MDVVPVSQSIVLDIDPRKADYTGTVEIVVDVRKPVRAFLLHGEKLDLKSATLATAKDSSAPIALRWAERPEGVLEMSALASIPTGRATLRIAFDNDFDTQAKGLYRLKSGEDWYAFTQFEAVDAREAFPCWDEPSFKIPYRMTLTVPSDQAAISNTQEERATESGGKRTIVFKTTRPLPSYLIAIAAGPVQLVPIPGTSVPARVVTPKGQSAMVAQAVATTPPILAALERYFGSRYPYDKLDLIAVPEYWYGAMENPGAITYLDRILLLDPNASDEARERLAEVTAHEIAHMWFGDLVTMAWWDDLWLNESFASWMEDKITAELFPEFHTEVGQVRSFQRVMGTDSQLTTRAMRRPVTSMDSLLQAADRLAYSKGSAVLHMVEGWIGPESFRSGVIAYLKAHADGNATASDLWNALGAASKQDVKGALSSFLDQPGVPIVSVEPLAGNKVRLTQRRFLNAGSEPPKAQRWRIPIALRYPEGGGMKTQRVMLTAPSQTVTLESASAPAWVHPNAGESGYYRWSVPPEMFARLAAEAKSVLAPRERLGFLGNAAALLDSGTMDGTSYLKVLESFATDPDPDVLRGVLDGLKKIRETFFAEERDAEFAPFVRRTLAPTLAELGMSRRPGEPLGVTMLRPDLLEALGDAGRDDTVLDEMERLARAYLADPASVDPELAGTAVKLSAIRGDPALFDLYRSRFESSKVPAERARLLRALAAFRDPALIDRTLDYAMTGPLRPQEIMSIPRALGENPAARAKTYAWMTQHYDQIAAKIPPDRMVFMPYFADGCSEERWKSAQTFFAEPSHAPQGTATELAKVGESVGDCVRLAAREGDSVRSYTASVP